MQGWQIAKGFLLGISRNLLFCKRFALNPLETMKAPRGIPLFTFVSSRNSSLQPCFSQSETLQESSPNAWQMQTQRPGSRAEVRKWAHFTTIPTSKGQEVLQIAFQKGEGKRLPQIQRRGCKILLLKPASINVCVQQLETSLWVKWIRISASTSFWYNQKVLSFRDDGLELAPDESITLLYMNRGDQWSFMHIQRSVFSQGQKTCCVRSIMGPPEMKVHLEKCLGISSSSPIHHFPKLHYSPAISP